MEEECRPCPMEKVHEVEYRLMSGQFEDIKERVGRLETQLNRGILLLVAILAGVATTLARALIQS
jgi:hypothetical protein